MIVPPSTAHATVEKMKITTIAATRLPMLLPSWAQETAPAGRAEGARVKLRRRIVAISWHEPDPCQTFRNARRRDRAHHRRRRRRASHPRDCRLRPEARGL